MTTRYAAHAVCLRGRTVLLARLREGDIHPGSWTLPGGGLAWREPPEQAVLRELHDGTGLEGRVKAILGIDTEVEEAGGGHAGLHSVRFLYRVEVDGYPHLGAHGSIVEVRWVPFGELVDLPLVTLVPRGLAMV